MSYNVKKSVIRDSFFALIVTLLVHGLFLVIFIAPTPKVRATVQPLPPVSVIDLTDTSDPAILEQIDYIQRHDPSIFVLGNESIGFSYVKKAPDMRGLSAPPEFNLNRPKDPLKLPIVDEVNVQLFDQPAIRGNQYLTSALLSDEGAESKAMTYPMIALGDERFTLDLTNVEQQRIAKLSSLDTILELDVTDKGAMPRVNIIKSCGDGILESFIVAELLKNSQLREKNGRFELNIRWRER